jgi:hypothetical protein
VKDVLDKMNDANDRNYHVWRMSSVE